MERKKCEKEQKKERKKSAVKRADPTINPLTY